MIKVISADDHPLVQAGLDALFNKTSDVQLAATVNNGTELIQALRNEPFDVAVVDIQMPGRSGIELIKQLKQEFPSLAVIVLSTHKEELFALRTLKAGASGYICKDYTVSDLIEAVRKVAKGQRFISPTVAELLAEDVSMPTEMKERHGLLSDREYQIFLKVAAGTSSTEIAKQLTLSIKTVSTHKARIKEKMKFNNDSEFTFYAIQHSLIDPSSTD